MESKFNDRTRCGYRSLAYIEYQWQFEKTVAEISNTFISATATQMDQAITKALCLCGEFFEVERSYIFQLSEDGKTKSNTHEWCDSAFALFEIQLRRYTTHGYCAWSGFESRRKKYRRDRSWKMPQPEPGLLEGLGPKNPWTRSGRAETDP